MNNSHTPASPCGTDERTNQPAARPLYKGLTKRETFAMAAMQGLLSSASDEIGQWAHGGADNVAREAVSMADELLKELER